MSDKRFDKIMKKHGMRYTNTNRTVCEVLREINDLCQGDDERDKNVRRKLFEAEHMAKRMALKLLEYNKDWDKDWWAANPNYEKNLKRRMNKHYCTGE